VRDRIVAITRGLTGRKAAPLPLDRIESLEKRVSHLETMVEGLQDNVHREITRTNDQIDLLRKKTEPAELSRALSEDARSRGL
jgi:uncharacterized coiled-coil protein SlyX